MMEADYDDEVSSSSFSRWVIPALVVSLALHAWFLYWAYGVSLAANSQKVYDRLVPRTFHVDRVEIDQKLLEP